MPAETMDRWSPVLHWLAVIAAVITTVGVVTWAHSVEPRGATAIERVEFLESDAAEIPPGGDWTPVALPVDRSTAPWGGESGWFRWTLPASETPEALLGLYLPLVRANAAIYWNGREIGRVGDFAGRSSRNWQVPFFALIPPGTVRAGIQRVHVRVDALPGKVALAKVWIGPHDALRRAFLFRRALKLTTVRLLTGVLLLTAAAMAAIWLRRRSDSIYGLFALLLLAFAGYSALFSFEEMPVPPRWWVWARVSVLAWFIVSIVIVVHRFFGVVRPRVERMAVLGTMGATAGTAILVVASPSWFDLLGTQGLPTVSLTLGLYPAALGFLILRRRSDFPALLLLFSGITLILFGSHDVLMVNHFVTVSDGYLVHYGASLVAGAFAWTLLTRFVDALSESETLNRDLAGRVAEKAAELERDHERLREIERKRVLAEERERLMSDIHDGVGGQIVSSLSLIESGRVGPSELGRVLRGALDDLRLVVDSMEPIEGDVAAVLGMVRHRLGSHVERSGVSLDWNVTDLPPISGFGPEKALHLARIVQEALTNALAHAGAQRIAVHAGVDESGEERSIWLEIADDGRGFPPSGPRRGHGLANMERRAAVLGGVLTVASSASGTTVRLGIPLT